MNENKNIKGKYTIIVGCGRLGANLANSLSDAGENVLIIDEKKESFRKLSPSYSGIAIIGDATEIFVLSEAQIEKATAIIAVTNNDNTNILVSQIAKELYNIHNVVARLYDPERECVYRDFNIKTVCPTTLSATAIHNYLDAAIQNNDQNSLKNTFSQDSCSTPNLQKNAHDLSKNSNDLTNNTPDLSKSKHGLTNNTNDLSKNSHGLAKSSTAYKKSKSIKAK